MTTNSAKFTTLGNIGSGYISISGYLETPVNIREDCFITPADIIVKIDGSVINARVSRGIYKNKQMYQSKKIQMPNMDEPTINSNLSQLLFLFHNRLGLCLWAFEFGS